MEFENNKYIEAASEMGMESTMRESDQYFQLREGLNSNGVAPTPTITETTEVNDVKDVEAEVVIDFSKIPGHERALFSKQLNSGVLSKEDFIVMYPKYTSPKPK